MVRSRSGASEPVVLFADFEVRIALAQQAAKAKSKVDEWPPDDLLGHSEDDVVAYITDQYSVDPPLIQRHGVEIVDQREDTIDVTGRFEYGAFDRSRSVRVTGQRVDVAVPFTGDATFFNGRATTYSFSPPRGVLKDAEVILVYRDVTIDGEQLRTRIERDIDDLEKHVGWMRTMCEDYNRDLPVSVRQWMQSRKERLLHQRNTVASIGLPMRQRDGDEPLLRVPVERRRVAVPRPAPIKGSSFVPEPEMADMDYEAALGVLESSRNTIERLARTTSRLTEEGIRDLLLVTLSGQFEGAAGGELFNGAGKTDILVRVDDRNVEGCWFVTRSAAARGRRWVGREGRR